MHADPVDLKLAQAFPAADAAQLGRLRAYVLLLSRWSKVHNLTGSKNCAAQLKLACDCAPLLDAIEPDDDPACDLGAGAGMPGMLLALLQPDRQVILVEAESSKAAFLEQARIELQAANVAVAHRRIETWRPRRRPQLLCARGVGRLAQLAAACRHLAGSGTRLLALKPRPPDAEIRELSRKHPRWQIVFSRRLDGAPSRYLVKARYH